MGFWHQPLSTSMHFFSEFLFLDSLCELEFLFTCAMAPCSAYAGAAPFPSYGSTRKS